MASPEASKSNYQMIGILLINTIIRFKAKFCITFLPLNFYNIFNYSLFNIKKFNFFKQLQLRLKLFKRNVIIRSANDRHCDIKYDRYAVLNGYLNGSSG